MLIEGGGGEWMWAPSWYDGFLQGQRIMLPGSLEMAEERTCHCRQSPQLCQLHRPQSSSGSYLHTEFVSSLGCYQAVQSFFVELENTKAPDQSSIPPPPPFLELVHAQGWT
jgi:hypothetical protein